MFKSQEMVKVVLLILERNVVAATEILAASRAFQMIGTTVQTSNTTSEQWQTRTGDFSSIERKALTVMQELDIEPGAAPEQQPHYIDPSDARRAITRMEREADEPVRALNDLKKQYADLETQLNQLQRLEDLQIPLERLHKMEYVASVIGTIPTENISRLNTSLEQLPHQLVEIYRTPTMTTIILFTLKSNEDRLNVACRSAYLHPIQIDDAFEGTPAEVMQRLRISMDRIQTHIEEYAATINRIHEARIQQLQHLYWRVRASRKVSQVIAGYDHYKQVYNVEGWMPVCEVDHLKGELLDLDETIEIELIPVTPDNRLPVPAKMDNPGLIKPFEFLVTNYGQPGYNEINPTWILALTFPLIFGTMFGDVGHGLVLALLGGLVLSGWIPSLRSMKALGGIVTFSGIASMIFGFLYGSIFGFEQVIPALWLRPLDNINSVLIVTVMAGAGFISLGAVFNIINNLMKHHWGEVLIGRNAVSGLILYWSLIALVARMFSIETIPTSILLPLIALTGISVLFEEPLANVINKHHPFYEGTLGTYLAQAFFEMFEVLISMLSNTLSYVRMGAFAVAHGALSMVIFILGDMVDAAHGIGYILVIILGNLFIIGFEGLIVTIQTLRLEYYELFSRFFMGDGLPFRPLRLLDQQTVE